MPQRPLKPGRRVNATGRSEGGAHHARFYRWELESAAFRWLSVAARALLLELKGLYTGNNNGTLFLSVREGARRLGIGKNQAAAAFAELQERGFIRPNIVGAFNLKAEARRGNATSWILTEFPIGEAKGAGSREFMRWQPSPEQESARAVKRVSRSQKDSTVPYRGQTVPGAGTVPSKPHLTVIAPGTLSAEMADRRSPLRAHR
ncbi:hypothetical protein [Reyranella sp.]|uniref:hypothetical protein n=1 Tax=Reyranella sp. TaxID=1929291 RepID=UPI004036F294